MKISNKYTRHGSASIASAHDLQRNGNFTRKPDSLLMGFHGNRKIYAQGMGGVCTVGGARSGKGACSALYTVLGASWDHSFIMLDVKAEGAAVSQLAVTLRGYKGIYWCPMPMEGVPAQHRINPFSHIRADSPMMAEDIMTWAINFIPTDDFGDKFFSEAAQRYLQSIAITVTLRDGVLTFPALAEAVRILGTPSEKYQERLGFYMTQAVAYPDVIDLEEEIYGFHKQGDSGQFDGIVGELKRRFQVLLSPALLQSLSPHPDGTYDFTFEDMMQPNQRYAVFLCVPQDFVKIISGITKTMFVAGRAAKAKAPGAPPVLWLIDEAGNIGAFPAAVELFTIGAGQGSKPWTIFQCTEQIENLAKGATNILLSSSQTRQFFGVRELATANMLSAMLGKETLYYEDTHAQERAAFERRQAMVGAMNGGSMLEAAVKMQHYGRIEHMQHSMQRNIRNPDEVLYTPENMQYIFTDGIPGAIFCKKRPYYNEHFMAEYGYLNNPFHPPGDKVMVKQKYWFGHKWLDIIEEPVPDKYAHLPQYQNGTWRRLSDA